MSTTLEIPEGSKAVISGKVIDGKNYLVVEVENEEQAPEWTKFKRGDVLKGSTGVMVLFDKYYYEYSMERHAPEIAFRSLINNKGVGNDGWRVYTFTLVTDKEKAEFYKWLRDKKGLEWDGEKLVEILKEGDLAIFWDNNTEDAIIAVYKRYDDDDGLYVDHNDLYWANAIKWDGTKEQYEKVLRGEVK